MASVSDAAVLVAVIAAGVAGLAYLARAARNVVRGARNVVQAVAAIQHIVERELEHNHGSSMKDDTHGMAVAIGKLQRDQDDDRNRFTRALQLAAKHHPEDALLYLGLAGPHERKHS